jgi:hypothetical protein
MHTPVQRRYSIFYSTEAAHVHHGQSVVASEYRQTRGWSAKQNSSARKKSSAGDMNPPAAAAPTGGADHASAPAPGYAPYPRLSPEDVPPPPPYHAATATPSAYGVNPYIASPAGAPAPAPKSASLHAPNLASSVADSVGPDFARSSQFFFPFLVFDVCRYDGLGERRAREDGKEGRGGGPQDRDSHRKLLAAL